MPIRVTCAHCGQRLSVPSEKAGRDVQCPRCRQVVEVAGQQWAGMPEAPRAPASDPSGGAQSQGEDAPISVLPSAASRPAVPPPGAGRTIQVPRPVVYMQGFLLGVVALVFFVFGLTVGSRSRSEPDIPPAQPCVVTGTVLYEDGSRGALPDESSVAVIVPSSTRPDQKATADGLRPADPAPAVTHPGMAVIRSLGGDYARVDRQGRYRLRVPAPGRYFLLIVSHHARRESHQQPQASDLAQIGRYFVPATSLLDSQQYTWREVRIRDDLEFNCRF